VITPETRAEICRLVRSEHLSITKAAKALGIHHSTVRNAIESEGRIRSAVRTKVSTLDPFVPFIQQKLDEYPDIPASAIWQMLKDRGFRGGETSVRARVATIRGQRRKKAYMPVTVFPGDEGQVDWAHFGSIQVGKAERKLSCFVMVLSHSRALFAKFFFDQTLDSFLAGHVEAFSYFGGVPRQIRYDNLKAAVAERFGQTIRYNSGLLEMAGYYAFKPSACNPYSGHEKGRVERNVRYIRDSFFIGKTFPTMEKINDGIAAWLKNIAIQRPWPDDKRKTVLEIWQEEKASLIPLPVEPFPVQVERPVRSGKVPFIRFDRNDYSIPYQLVGQPLSLSANQADVLIRQGSQLVAQHSRSFSCGERIINQVHFHGLTANRPGAETVAARCYFNELIPGSNELFSLMVERGSSIGPATAKLFELLRMYGKSTLKEAVSQAISRRYGEVNYVARICDQIARRDKKSSELQLPLDLPAETPGADLHVRPHESSSYDDLIKE
jgi:transposase